MSNQEIAINYAHDVLNEKLVACNFVKLACHRFLNDLENQLYYYDENQVDNVINFFNRLYLSEQTKPIHFFLENWQIFIIANIYGLYKKSTNTRKFKYAYLEMSRKNGKSQFATALSIYHLIVDDYAQVIISANSKDQAKNVDFKKCKQFALQLDKSKKHLKHYYNSIKYKNSELIVVASDSSKLDGLNTSFAIIDELHAAPSPLMYNVIKSSMGSRLQPIFFVITTAGFDCESFCFKLRGYAIDVLQNIIEDESQFSMIFTLDENDDFEDKKVWKKANPNMNISVQEDFLKSEVNKAKNFESEKNGVLVKNFNIWLKSNSYDDWISEKYIVQSMKNISITDDLFIDQPCFVGVDLSSVSDITAVAKLFVIENKLYFFVNYYLPELSINSNLNKDLFKNAATAKHIYLTSGNVVDYDKILEDLLILNETNQIQIVSYDKWNSTQFAINATAAGLNLVPYSQTAGSLNKPIKEFQKLILSENLVLEKNIITKFCLNNTVVKQNVMGNFSIDKSSKSKKIDGVAAMLNCLGAYLDSPRYTFSIN